MNIAPDRPRNAPTTVENADLTVVGGAGHVGVPLVLAFARRGVARQRQRLNEDTLAILKAGRLPFIEHGAQTC